MEACSGRLRLGPVVGAREAGGDAPCELTGLPRAAPGLPAAPQRGPGRGSAAAAPGSSRCPGGSVHRAPVARAPSTPPPPPRHVFPGPHTCRRAETPERVGRPSAAAGWLCLPSVSATAARVLLSLPPPPSATLLPRSKARSL